MTFELTGLRLGSFLGTRPVQTTQPETAGLAEGTVLSRMLRAGDIVRGITGTVWVTFEGEGEDILLQSGQEVMALRQGRAVVQSLENYSQVRFDAR